MKVLIMPDGTEKKIISETDRYYKTEDSQYKKAFWANCTKEIEEAEEKPTAKKSAKKSAKKAEEKGE